MNKTQLIIFTEENPQTYLVTHLKCAYSSQMLCNNTFLNKVFR